MLTIYSNTGVSKAKWKAFIWFLRELIFPVDYCFSSQFYFRPLKLYMYINNKISAQMIQQNEKQKFNYEIVIIVNSKNTHNTRFVLLA